MLFSVLANSNPCSKLTCMKLSERRRLSLDNQVCPIEDTLWNPHTSQHSMALRGLRGNWGCNSPLRNISGSASGSSVTAHLMQGDLIEFSFAKPRKNFDAFRGTETPKHHTLLYTLTYTSIYYRIEGFKGSLSWAPIMPRAFNAMRLNWVQFRPASQKNFNVKLKKKLFERLACPPWNPPYITALYRIWGI